MKKNYVIIDSIERKKNLAKKNKAELYNEKKQKYFYVHQI